MLGILTLPQMQGIIVSRNKTSETMPDKHSVSRIDGTRGAISGNRDLDQ